MLKRGFSILLVFAIAISFIIFSENAIAEEIDDCTVIGQPGQYQLTQDIVDAVGDCFVIESDDVEFDGQGFKIDGTPDSSEGYFAFVANGHKNITIKNAKIGEFGDYLCFNVCYGGGIYFDDINESEISNIEQTSGAHGIWMTNSHNNKVFNANLSKNANSGFYFDMSSHNSLSNIFSNVSYSGFFIAFSNNNDFSDIMAYETEDTGIYLQNSANNTLKNSLLYYSGNIGLYLASFSDNNYISNLTARQFGTGITIDNSNFNNLNTITSSDSFDSGISIIISSSVSNSLDNVVCNNNSIGIFLQLHSNFTTLSNVNLSENKYDGLRMQNTMNNFISNFSSNYNGEFGMTLDSSDSNKFYNVETNFNKKNGTWLLSSNYNEIINFTSNNNSDRGLLIQKSSNNDLRNMLSKYNAGIGLHLEESKNNKLSNINTSYNTYGTFLNEFSNNNSISNITAISNMFGVYMFSSNNNTLNGITANSNEDTGLNVISSSGNTFNHVNTSRNTYGTYLEISSQHNNLNDVTTALNFDTGIWLQDSSFNNLSRIVANLNSFGVYIEQSSNNYFTDITANSNDDTGVNPIYSHNNTFYNTVANFNTYGVYLDFAENNSLINVSTEKNYYGVNLVFSIGNRLVNLNSKENAGAAIFDHEGNTNNSLIFNNAFGEIEFLGNKDNLNMTENNILYPGTIIIGINNAVINAENLTNLNKSSIITLRNVPTDLSNYIIKKDNIRCSDCYNFTPLNSGTAIFNASGSGIYSIDGSFASTFSVKIINPAGTTYSSSTIPVEIVISKPGNCNYSVDHKGTVNLLSPNSSNTGFTGIATINSNGNYVLEAYCRDNTGSTNEGQAIGFIVDIPPTTTSRGSGGGSSSNGRGRVINFIAPDNPNSNYDDLGNEEEIFLSSKSGEESESKLNQGGQTSSGGIITFIVLFVILIFILAITFFISRKRRN